VNAGTDREPVLGLRTAALDYDDVVVAFDVLAFAEDITNRPEPRETCGAGV
jgi:hypothetical protein